jgi:signal peptidase I
MTRDHVIVQKLYAPRRWDLAAFQWPEDPNIVYVKRVVGFPGEEVAIRDGDVWIDGKRAAKPEQIAALRYWGAVAGGIRPRFEEDVDANWGPATLGASEYFMLGDFSLISFDARYWKVGVPGHPSYAVPESHIVGIVTHIYWPPWRWRVFR